MKQELWETVKKYYLHWWNNDFIGRIPFWVSAPKDDPRSQKALFGKHLWILEKEKFDTEKIIKNAREILRATFYGGLAFPVISPTLEPMFFRLFGSRNGIFRFFPPVATGPSFIKEDVISVSWAKWGNRF